MLRNFISVLMVITLLVTALFREVASAATQADKEAKQAAKTKQKVAKLGTGESARISFELRDHTKLKGYVSEIGDETFVVTSFKTKATTTVAYRDVTSLRGKGLPMAANVAIIAGVAGAGLVLVWVFAYHAGND